MHRCGARTLYPALNKYLVQGKGQLHYGMGTKTHEEAFTIGFQSGHFLPVLLSTLFQLRQYSLPQSPQSSNRSHRLRLSRSTSRMRILHCGTTLGRCGDVRGIQPTTLSAASTYKVRSNMFDFPSTRSLEDEGQSGLLGSGRQDGPNYVCFMSCASSSHVSPNSVFKDYDSPS